MGRHSFIILHGLYLTNSSFDVFVIYMYLTNVVVVVFVVVVVVMALLGNTLCHLFPGSRILNPNCQ